MDLELEKEILAMVEELTQLGEPKFSQTINFLHLVAAKVKKLNEDKAELDEASVRLVRENMELNDQVNSLADEISELKDTKATKYLI